MSSTIQTDPMRQLAQTLTKSIDTNNDSKIDTEEFTSFLGRLLGAASAPSTAKAVGIPPITTLVTPPAVYRPMPGFDGARMANRLDDSPKYEFIRWVLDRDLPPTTESLQQFVDANPDWEMRNKDNIRLKQSALDLRSPGKTVRWQDAIVDVGGPNASWSYFNADPD